MNSLYVVNLEGEKEKFSFNKVRNSARRAGASNKLAKEIAEIIEEEVFPGIETAKIYRRVKELLAQEEFKPALKFSLKKAMRELGPTGFPFEKYISKVFSRNGFKVKLNQQIPSFCCGHYEIDFLAENKDVLYIGECKFRNVSGGKVHSSDALMNYARFLDIKRGKFFNNKRNKLKSILVTNTKFTKKSIRYSKCVGVELLGWKYPRGKGLESLIEKNGLYPITILPSFKKNMRDVFSKKKIMFAEDILRIDIDKFFKNTNIKKKYLEHLKREAKILLD